jgi:hypothetical protein
LAAKKGFTASEIDKLIAFLAKNNMPDNSAELEAILVN